MNFQVITAATIKLMVFWDVAPCFWWCPVFKLAKIKARDHCISRVILWETITLMGRFGKEPQAICSAEREDSVLGAEERWDRKE